MARAARIVIVGAGIAGIGAAQRLAQHGYKNVVVLEGDDRVGGRINTQKYGVGTIEMGAQWIHGESNNPVYELSFKNNLIVVQPRIDDDKAIEAHRFCLSDGTSVDSVVVRETLTFLGDALNGAERFARDGVSPDGDEETVGAFVRNAFYEYLRTRGNDSEETGGRSKEEGLFNWYLLLEKSLNGCPSVDEMSLAAWGEYVWCDGNMHVELARGYRSALDVLLEDVLSASIRLNAHVDRIVWNNDERTPSDGETNSNLGSGSGADAADDVVVTMSDGESYRADHVIVTSSLGYLKLHADDLFLPALPPQKALAVRRLGFGTVNKIYLEFEDAFWEKDCRGIQLTWLPGERLLLDCLENGKDASKECKKTLWYQGIQGFDVVPSHPNLLRGWIAGTEAEEMEDLADDVVLDVCHELLQRFTGNRRIRRPIKITRTKWFNSRYAVGSYSYRRTGSTVVDCDELAKPLPSTDVPRLQFAGEATHRYYFSTTHGALLSGQREADRIIDLYKNRHRP